MKLQDLLSINDININLHSQNKIDLLTQMSNSLASKISPTDNNMILTKILERESVMSTGIGYGIAIPHCRIPDIDRFFMISARTTTGIDFASIDGQAVRIVFMIISPVNFITEHTQILAALSKLMSQENIRDQLLKANSTQEYHSVITGKQNE
jgi:fructose PTS system EIIBC or EIIC component